MKRWVLPLLIGLVVGLGGSSGLIAWLGPEADPLRVSLAAALRSAESDSVWDESEHAGESDPIGVPEEMDEAAVEEEQPATERADSEEGAGAGAPPANEQEDALPRDRLARLFGSMQPREAARVLEHMDDFEVQVILGQLGNREAAAILSSLSPERAAVISRSVIRGERSTP